MMGFASLNPSYALLCRVGKGAKRRARALDDRLAVWIRGVRDMKPDFDSMNETDVREIIVRPLLARLGYAHGTQANIRPR